MMHTTPLPPDASERDAARRQKTGEDDTVITGDDIHVVTEGVSGWERAAVIAVLARVRNEETQRVKRRERRERQPWARSQRVPEGITELLTEG